MGEPGLFPCHHTFFRVVYRPNDAMVLPNYGTCEIKFPFRHFSYPADFGDTVKMLPPSSRGNMKQSFVSFRLCAVKLQQHVNCKKACMQLIKIYHFSHSARCR